MKTVFEVNESKIEVSENKGTLLVDGEEYDYEILEMNDESLLIKIEGENFRISKLDAELIKVNKIEVDVKPLEKERLMMEIIGIDPSSHQNQIPELKAPMPGSIVKLIVSEGDEVKKGDDLMILEAMKMENLVKSPTDGQVQKIHVSQGQIVQKNDLMISF